MFVDISKVFTERQIDITSMNVRTSKQGKATIVMTFDIHGIEELNKLSDKLRQIEGVLDIVDFKLRGKVGRKIRILLPESFEYIILASGIIKVDKTKLVETYNFAESSVYFSWERYYTELLEDESNGMYKKDKNAIPMFLRNPSNIKKFYDFVKEVDVC